MRPLQSVQRRTGFETLEAKKLFAADLTGGAAIDLPDTAIVDGFGSIAPSTGLLSPASIGLVNANLGGQEGEDFLNTDADNCIRRRGDFQGLVYLSHLRLRRR